MSEHTARKRFGQNFLHDRGTIARIMGALAPAPEDHFVEIGPGQGAITRPLSEVCAELDVIEIDRDLATKLEATDWARDINVYQADALKFDFNSLQSDSSTPLRLVGNLPYNISTPLLFHILTFNQLFSDMHVMLQKEVVQRMTAGPGSRTYGRLSVALAARCDVQSLFVIKPGAFNPAPKVHSAFARLTPLPDPLVSAKEAPLFDEIVRCAFGQRRKQLHNALQTVMTAELIEKAGVDPATRAEQLPVEQFVSLTRVAGSQNR